MKLLICILFAATATVNFSFANCYKPQRHNFSKLIIDSSINNMSSGKDAPKSSAKICACQVLQVTSNNDPDQFIAVFAEGTNTCIVCYSKRKKALAILFLQQSKSIRERYERIQLQYAL